MAHEVKRHPRFETRFGLISRNGCRQALTVDTEGRVGVFTRSRWPVMAAAWLIAVVLITLLTSRGIHVVGRRLSSNVSLPRPHVARQPAALPPQTPTVSPTGHP